MTMIPASGRVHGKAVILHRAVIRLSGLAPVYHHPEQTVNQIAAPYGPRAWQQTGFSADTAVPPLFHAPLSKHAVCN